MSCEATSCRRHPLSSISCLAHEPTRGCVVQACPASDVVLRSWAGSTQYASSCEVSKAWGVVRIYALNLKVLRQFNHACGAIDGGARETSPLGRWSNLHASTRLHPIEWALAPKNRLDSPLMNPSISSIGPWLRLGKTSRLLCARSHSLHTSPARSPDSNSTGPLSINTPRPRLTPFRRSRFTPPHPQCPQEVNTTLTRRSDGSHLSNAQNRA